MEEVLFFFRNSQLHLLGDSLNHREEVFSVETKAQIQQVAESLVASSQQQLAGVYLATMPKTSQLKEALDAIQVLRINSHK